jgi:hypothetical protein
MPSDRKKPGVAFWTTVVLVVVLVAYALSCGPTFALAARTGPRAMEIWHKAYEPLSWLNRNVEPQWARKLHDDYIHWWLSRAFPPRSPTR